MLQLLLQYYRATLKVFYQLCRVLCGTSSLSGVCITILWSPQENHLKDLYPLTTSHHDRQEDKH